MPETPFGMPLVIDRCTVITAKYDDIRLPLSNCPPEGMYPTDFPRFMCTDDTQTNDTGCSATTSRKITPTNDRRAPSQI